MLHYDLFKGDAVYWLKTLEDNSIDLVVTDPPYESIEKYRKLGTTTRLKKSKGSNCEWFSYFPDDRYDDLFSELYRVMKNNTHLYVFCNHETLFTIKPCAEKVGFKYWKPLVWKKNRIGMGYHYRARYEFIVFFEKGKKRLNSLSIPDVLEYDVVWQGYPTEKPVGLCETLIKQSSNTADLVLDPFMGSGTTGLAALKNRRRFIGFDTSEKAIKLSQTRLSSVTTVQTLESTKLVKSPLRYPGGKSKAVKKILPLIPTDYDVFIEPMVGGGSVFLAAKQVLNPDAKYIISDINRGVYAFWKMLKDRPKELIADLHAIRNITKEGRWLFHILKEQREYTEYEEALRFFVLNRITFSGTLEAGGYSEESFHSRFTVSSIDRLEKVYPLLDNVEVLNEDYGDILAREHENAFVFLDPPYKTQTESRLYGKKGQLHLDFDHSRLFSILEKCPYRWLMTYDDCEEIKEMYEDIAHVIPWTHTYSMDNYKQKSTKRGKELFLTNLDSLKFSW